MNLQMESIYRQRTTQKLQILKMDEHPGNDQGQQTRGRRGVRMHGSVQRQNRGRGHGQRWISDDMHIRWNKGHCCGPCCQSWSYNGWGGLKGAAKYWEIDHILNNSNISKQSLSINIPRTVKCFVLLKWIYGIHKKCSLSAFQYTVTVIQTVAI